MLLYNATKHKKDLNGDEKRKLLWIAIPLVMLIVTTIALGYWYYFLGPCGVDRVEKSLDRIDRINNKWLSSIELASSTSRIALAVPVSYLQAIRQELYDLVVPVCLDKAKDHLGYSMKFGIDGFLAFMADESDQTIKSQLDLMKDYTGLASTEIERIRSCAPFCK